MPNLLDNHTMGLVCDALRNARGNADPFLEELVRNEVVHSGHLVTVIHMIGWVHPICSFM